LFVLNLFRGVYIQPETGPRSGHRPARRIPWLTAALILALGSSTLVALSMHNQRTDPVNAAAQALLERDVQLAGGSAIPVAALARSFARRGSRNDALGLLAALERDDHGYAAAYELAKVPLDLPNSERAIDLRERALDERAQSIAFVHVDPHLNAIRHNSRFQKLVKRVE
jgi:hypothetical protein